MSFIAIIEILLFFIKGDNHPQSLHTWIRANLHRN